MSESPSDEFDKERSEQEGEELENSQSTDEKDPFAALSSEDDPDQDENTLQRLSHLTPDESVLPDGENTIARLAALHPDAELVSPQEGENTVARLSQLSTDEPNQSDGENTTARLGNFMDSLLDEEPEASELDGADELTDGQELDAEVSARGDLTDGLLDESGQAASGLDPFDFGGGSGSDLDSGLDDLGGFGDTTTPESEAEPEPVDKKGKKAKKAKPKASDKAQKPKKERKTKVARPKREKRPWSGVDTVVAIVCVFFVLVIIGGNLWALLLAKGIAVSFFLTLFNLFGLILLLVPYLLWAKKRREGAITFYDTLLALTLTLLIFGCMLILSVQARYGTDIKASGRVLTEWNIQAGTCRSIPLSLTRR